MNMITRTMGAAALLALAIPMAQAQEAVGYNKIVVPAETDALVSVPFTKQPAGTFTVSSADDELGGVIIQEAFDEVGMYANTHYVKFTSGDGTGYWSTITSNSVSEMILENPVGLADVGNGDTVVVYEHQTLASLFPQEYEGVTFISSGDTGTETGSTVVLVPDTNTGINKSSGKVCQHFGQYGWFDGDFNNADDIVIPPATFVKVRNRDTTDLPVIVSGEVTSTPIITALSKVTQDNDLYLANPYPVPVNISEMGLDSWASSNDGATFNGQVLVFNNDAAGINKSSTKICFFFTGDGNWYDGGFNVVTDLNVPAGMGVVLREQSDSSSTDVWSAPKPY